MTGDGSRRECTICSEFLETDVQSLPDCRHTFHRACITPWLESHNGCPDCPQLNSSGDESSTCLKCSKRMADDKVTFDCGHAFHFACLTHSCFECERHSASEECTSPTHGSAGCALCSEVVLENVLTPSCGHTYHRVCLNEWLKLHNTCSSCPQQSESQEPASGDDTTNSCPDCHPADPPSLEQAVACSTSTHSPTTCLICFQQSDSGEELSSISPTTCIICSEEILPKNGKTLHCGHTFHKVCINSWQNSCPHCHQPSPLIQQTVTPNQSVPLPETETEECSICLEEASLEAVSLQCGHSFHIECLTPWLGEQCICPNCREPCIIHIPGYVYRTMQDSPFFSKIMNAAQVGSLDLILYS